MRGALDIKTNRDMNLRIIPADAGSTRKEFRDTMEEADHPRGCGEHSPTERNNHI